MARLAVWWSSGSERSLSLYNYILIPHSWLRERLSCCVSRITGSASCFDSAILRPATFEWRKGLMRFRFISSESHALLKASIQPRPKVGLLCRLQGLRLLFGHWLLGSHASLAPCTSEIGLTVSVDPSSSAGIRSRVRESWPVR